jgi:hypothetical protein
VEKITISFIDFKDSKCAEKDLIRSASTEEAKAAYWWFVDVGV